MKFSSEVSALHDISSSKHFMRVSCGKEEGYISVFKFGSNPDVDTSTEEDIWSVGGDLLYLSTAELISVASTEGADTMKVTITGVDQDYKLVSDTITLNGATPVVSAVEFLRVWRAEIADDAVIGNIGVITGTADTALTAQFQMEIGVGQTEMSHFTVPVGYTGFVYSIFASTSPNDSAVIKTKTATSGGAFKTNATVEVAGSFTARYFSEYPIALTEKTDIKFTAQALTQNTRVTASYRVVLVKNSILDE